MEQNTTHFKKSVLIDLYLFYILYFALILAERQLLRSGLFIISFPIELDLLETGAGFVLGSGIIIILTLLIKEKQYLIRVALATILVLGAAYISIFVNMKIFYPPFITTSPGDLNSLGEERWIRDLPYGLYADVYDQYLLQDIHVNPNINNYDELARTYRFGVYLKTRQNVPSSITKEQFAGIEEIPKTEYLLHQKEGSEYRLYRVNEGEKILITTFDNITLFIPMDYIKE
jgi:hypothetical protein